MIPCIQELIAIGIRGPTQQIDSDHIAGAAYVVRYGCEPHDCSSLLRLRESENTRGDDPYTDDTNNKTDSNSEGTHGSLLLGNCGHILAGQSNVQ